MLDMFIMKGIYNIRCNIEGVENIAVFLVMLFK